MDNQGGGHKINMLKSEIYTLKYTLVKFSLNQISIYPVPSDHHQPQSR